MKETIIVGAWLMKEYKKVGTAIVLTHLQANKYPYFSVTGFHSEGCGCIHDLILEEWPELKPLTDMHLANEDGAPMYDVANGWYWYNQGNDEALAKHLRISQDEALYILWKDFNKEEFTEYIEDHRLRWKAEADEAIALIRKLATAHKNSVSRKAYEEFERKVVR